MCMCVSADIDFSTKLPLTWIFVSLSICSVSRCPIGHLDTEQIEMPFGGRLAWAQGTMHYMCMGPGSPNGNGVLEARYVRLHVSGTALCLGHLIHTVLKCAFLMKL